MNSSESQQDRILFFDGVCHLCNRLIDFLILRSKHRPQMKFASLQGSTAAKYLTSMEIQNLNTVIYLREGKLYQRSSAILYAMIDLGGLWKGFAIFFLVPIFLRNWIYDFVAKNRYSWFGKRDSCRLPNSEERDRLLP